MGRYRDLRRQLAGDRNVEGAVKNNESKMAVILNRIQSASIPSLQFSEYNSKAT